MEVTYDAKTNSLTIKLACNANPQPSKSGKTLLLATTGGFVQTAAQFKGKPIAMAVNVTIPKG